MCKYFIWGWVFTNACSATFEFISPNITGIEAEVGTNFDIAWEGATGSVTLWVVDSAHTQTYGLLQRKSQLRQRPFGKA